MIKFHRQAIEEQFEGEEDAAPLTAEQEKAIKLQEEEATRLEKEEEKAEEEEKEEKALILKLKKEQGKLTPEEAEELAKIEEEEAATISEKAERDRQTSEKQHMSMEALKEMQKYMYIPERLLKPMYTALMNNDNFRKTFGIAYSGRGMVELPPEKKSEIEAMVKANLDKAYETIIAQLVKQGIPLTDDAITTALKDFQEHQLAYYSQLAGAGVLERIDKSDIQPTEAPFYKDIDNLAKYGIKPLRTKYRDPETQELVVIDEYLIDIVEYAQGMIKGAIPSAVTAFENNKRAVYMKLALDLREWGGKLYDKTSAISWVLNTDQLMRFHEKVSEIFPRARKKKTADVKEPKDVDEEIKTSSNIRRGLRLISAACFNLFSEYDTAGPSWELNKEGHTIMRKPMSTADAVRQGGLWLYDVGQTVDFDTNTHEIIPVQIVARADRRQYVVRTSYGKEFKIHEQDIVNPGQLF